MPLPPPPLRFEVVPPPSPPAPPAAAEPTEPATAAADPTADPTDPAAESGIATVATISTAALPVDRASARAALAARLSPLLRKLELSKVELAGKRLLLRLELNVGGSGCGAAADELRLKAALPAILLARQKGARSVAILAHLGRPEEGAAGAGAGELSPAREARHSLRPLAEVLQHMLGAEVPFAFVCEGPLAPEADAALVACPPGGVVLFEDLRFCAGEVAGLDGEAVAADALGASLALLGDVYCLETFGVAEDECRSDASLSLSLLKVPLPVRCAGPLLAQEIEALAACVLAPRRPLCAVVGGDLIKAQRPHIEALLNVCDELVLGGPLALAVKSHAFGVQLGASVLKAEDLAEVDWLLAHAKERRVRVHLPCDYIAADLNSPDATRMTSDDMSGVPKGLHVLDIGPRTVARFRQPLRRAMTIVWLGGPMGCCEFEKFAGGTKVRTPPSFPPLSLRCAHPPPSPLSLSLSLPLSLRCTHPPSFLPFSLSKVHTPPFLSPFLSL
ncbi:phosphoglycerate kinase [Pavlovales sp. CCMP2436]|nr:phosphoglycerate kinase [Pavlovales sp. CCMP2436]